MAGTMNAVMPNVPGPGIKPSANPDPVQQAPSAPAQMEINSLPPPTQPETQAQPAQQAQPNAPAQPDQPAQPQLSQEEIDARVGAAFGDKPPQKPDPNQGVFDRVSNYVKSSIQDLKGKVLTGGARNEQEQENGLIKAFGEGNFKVSKDGVQVRADAQSPWRKFKEDDFIKWSTPMVKLLSQSAENAPGLAPQAPGMMAQFGLSGSGMMAGAMAGMASPVPGGAMVGGLVGGLAGGYAGTQAKKYLDQKVQDLLGVSDPSFKYENKMSDLTNILHGDLSGAANNDYIQTGVSGVTGALVGRGLSNAATSAAAKMELAFKGLSEPEISAIQNASKKEMALAKVHTSIQNVIDTTMPAVETPFTSESGTPVGVTARGVMDARHQRLGQQIGALEADATQLQSKKGKYLQPTNFQQAFQEVATKYGMEFDEGGAITNESLMNSAPKNLGDLIPAYNRAQQIKELNTSTQGFKEGLPLPKARDLFETLSGLSDDSGSKTGRWAFGKIRAALNLDRTSHMAELFGGEQSESAQAYKNVMAEFSTNADAVRSLQKGLLKDNAAQQMIITDLAGTGTKTKLRNFQNLRTALGQDDPTFFNIQNGVLNEMKKQFTDGGVVNAKGFKNYLEASENQPMLRALYNVDVSTDPKSIVPLNMLKGALGQAQELQNAIGLTSGQRALIEAIGKVGMEQVPGGPGAAKFVAAFSKNNKPVVDQLKQTLLDGVAKATSEDQRNILWKELNEIEPISSSNVVTVPTKTGEPSIKRYLFNEYKPKASHSAP